MAKMIRINKILLDKYEEPYFFHYGWYNVDYKGAVSEYVFNNDLLHKMVKTKKRLAFYNQANIIKLTTIFLGVGPFSLLLELNII